MATPYYLKSRKCWYVWIGSGSDRRQVNLGREKQAAWAKYHELMANPVPETTGTSMPVVKLLDDYLRWVEINRKPRTLEWYLQYLGPFSKHIGKRLTVNALKPYHVTKWLQKDHRTSSSTTIHGAIRSIQRAFNWAIDEEYLDKSPVARIKKPKPNRRETVISQTQFTEMLTKATDQPERDLLTFLWETGTRPQEIIIIEARHVQLQHRCIVFDSLEGKGKQARTIYLSDEALAIVARLSARHTTGPIFRNSKDKAWNKNSIKCRFRKYKTPGLCASLFRHSFVTRSLFAGIDPITVAILCGHKDTKMIATTYSHISQNPAYLKEQLKKLKET